MSESTTIPIIKLPVEDSLFGESTRETLMMLPPPPRAAEFITSSEDGPSNSKGLLYWDRSHYNSPEKQMEALVQSSTLYIGNLAFSTRSRHVRAHFAQLPGAGVQRVIMGLNRGSKTPCGFAFCVMKDRAAALAAVSGLSGTKLDGRIIRVELDAGFLEGRQYGRGKLGGQTRDDRSTTPSGHYQQQPQHFSGDSRKRRMEQSGTISGTSTSFLAGRDAPSNSNDRDQQDDRETAGEHAPGDEPEDQEMNEPAHKRTRLA